MGDTHDTVIGKIKALLRLAEDSRARGSLHEAEAAMARVEEMIQRYRLESAAVFAAASPEAREPDEAIGDVVVENVKRKSWRDLVVVVLARHHGCKGYYWRRWNGSADVNELHVVGRSSDVATVRYLAAWVVSEITRLAEDYMRTGRWHNSPRAARNAFCVGAVRGFSEAMKRGADAAREAHRATAGAAASSAAAMVLRDRDVELARYFERDVGKLRKGRGLSVSDGGAYGAGKAAGGRIQTSHRAGLGGGSGASSEVGREALVCF